MAKIDKLVMKIIITSALDDSPYCAASKQQVCKTPRMTMAELDRLIMKDIITSALTDPPYNKR